MNVEKLLSVQQKFVNKQDSLFQDFCDGYKTKILPKAKEFFDYRDKCREEYGFETNYNFNIFKSITEVYWREKIHSYILYEILNPETAIINTDEKDNNKNLKDFFEFIGLNKAISKWNFEEIFVETEVGESGLSELLGNDYESDSATEGNIDILICDKKNCVIIENKINNAPDMKNQLQRYVRIAQNQGLTVQKIVYIPPTVEKAPPDCDEEYKNEDEIVKKCILILPAVKKHGDNSVKSLAQDFLDILIEETSKKNRTRLVFLEQYKNLVIEIGENAIMEGMEKKLVKELYWTKQSQKDTEELYEFLASLYGQKIDKLFDKSDALYERKYSVICDELEKKGFSCFEDDEFFYVKKLSDKSQKDAEIFLFHCMDFGGQYGIGIRREKEKGKGEKPIEAFCENLANKLENLLSQNECDDNWYWIFENCSDHENDFLEESISEALKFLSDRLAEIEAFHAKNPKLFQL